MKGNAKIIEKLNDLLSDELTAINQYMLHAEMCDNWKYEVLHKVGEKRAIDEMKHAEKLIARILFLDGQPVVSNLKKITIGADVEKQHKNDHALELMAIKSYNEGIQLGSSIEGQRHRGTARSHPQGRRRPYRCPGRATRSDRADGDPELPHPTGRLSLADPCIRHPVPA